MPATTLLRRLAWIATVFALGVIVFGAFVRLSNAGLSCPDWPTCYGKATWPGHEHEIAHANANFDRPVETHRAWREQVHRMIAGTLGLLVLGIATAAAWRRWTWVGALIVFGHIGALAWLAVRRGQRGLGLLIGALLCLQVSLGIGNVLLDLPLAVATAHNGVAALLLLALLALLVRTQLPVAPARPL